MDKKMWLINFHLGFSASLFFAFIGIYCMFRKKIERKISGMNRQLSMKKLVNIIKLLLFMFMPCTNIVTLLALLFIIVADKKVLENAYNKSYKKEKS